MPGAWPMITWQQATVRVYKGPGEIEELPGWKNMNLGIARRPGLGNLRRYVAAHQPSGLRLFEHAPMLRDAKFVLRDILEEFGPEILDRIAADAKLPGDDAIAREIVDRLRPWREI